MATTIVTKSGSGAPTASDLVAGELAVDLTNGRLYTEDSGGTVLELGLNPNGNVNVTGSVTADGLTLSDSTNPTLTITDITNPTSLVLTAGNLSTTIGTTTDHPLKFATNDTERLRLDTSGNLLVGKTATAFGTAGVEASASNGLWSTRSGLPALALNRLSTDGSIADFYKDGTTVGSILSSGGDGIIVQGVAAGSGLLFHNSDALLPAQNGNAIDATIDLGRTTPSAFRFKDLYLSGGVNIGNGSVATGGDNYVYSYSGGSSGQVRSGIKLNGTNNQLEFFTNQAERMRIDSSGNVGIGTSSPVTALDVRGEISVDYDATYGLRFYNEDRNNWSSIGNTIATGIPSANLVFKTSIGEAMRIDASGRVTKPYQPAFLELLSGDQANIPNTGAPTTITFNTEVYDVGGDFSTTTHTFTAPVTGKYQLNVSLLLGQLDSAATYYQVQLTTSNRIFYNTFDPRGLSQDLNYWEMPVTVIADMDANDTAIVKIVQSGGTTQTDIINTAVFSGFLAC